MADLDSRLAVVESKTKDHADELQRHRDRLHVLETRDAIVAAFMESVVEIRGDVKKLLLNAAADDAVNKWKHWAIGTSIALAGVVAAFLFLKFH